MKKFFAETPRSPPAVVAAMAGVSLAAMPKRRVFDFGGEPPKQSNNNGSGSKNDDADHTSKQHQQQPQIFATANSHNLNQQLAIIPHPLLLSPKAGGKEGEESPSSLSSSSSLGHGQQQKRKDSCWSGVFRPRLGLLAVMASYSALRWVFFSWNLILFFPVETFLLGEMFMD
jgi:hypothetical protein